MVGLGPALRCSTVSRRADFARAFIIGFTVDGRVDGKSDVVVTAFHDRDVVSCAFLAVVLAVAELEKGLVLPLAGDTPVGVSREAHADVFKGSRNGLGSVSSNRDWVHALEHLEAAGDLVEAEVLGGRALVTDFDADGIGAALGELGDGRSCRRQGEQRAEEPACGVHVGVVNVMVLCMVRVRKDRVVVRSQYDVLKSDVVQKE